MIIFKQLNTVLLAAVMATAGLLLSCKSNVEPHGDVIIDHIINTRDAIIKKNPDAQFITFWDFDGTIQKGDCTTGLTINEKEVFKGLAEKAIDASLVKEYPPGSFDKFRKKVDFLNQKDHIDYLLYFPQVLVGKSEREIIGFSEKYFESTLKKYFFSTSVAMIEALKKEKIRIYVISASADVYVQGSAKVLGIPNYQIRGIAMKTRKGKITDNPEEPITYGPGKTEVLKATVTRLKRTTGSPVFVLAGFGNSYSTDGDFLNYIAGQTLPAGKALSVMINGGNEPEKYKGRFVTVLQEKTILP